MKRHSVSHLFRTVLIFTTIVTGAIASGWMPMGCGGTNKTLEEAIFYLDQCNATVEATLTSNCTPALNAANDVLVSQPSNLEAAIASSSASLGLARFDLLSFLSDLSGLGSGNSDSFDEFQGFIATFEGNSLEAGGSIQVDHLHTAITSLSTALSTYYPTPDTTGGVANDPLVRRAYFQLGLLQAIDAFVRPVKLSGSVVATVETAITDTETAYTLSDYINADNNLTLGGVTSDERIGEILRPVRENFCRCKGNGGFTQNCLQDLMRCELYSSGIEGDYDGNSTANFADCLTLLTPADLDTCAAADTEN